MLGCNRGLQELKLAVVHVDFLGFLPGFLAIAPTTEESSSKQACRMADGKVEFSRKR